MVAPLIFVPGGQGFGENLLAPLGLADHVIGCEFVQAQSGPAKIPGAPDGRQNGVMCAWPKPEDSERRKEYRPDEQVWMPADPVDGLDSGRYFLGYWKHAPPEPKDFQRAEVFDGYWIELGDGHKWLLANASRLPRDWRRGTNGSIEKVVQDRFQDFWNQSLDWFQVLMSADVDDGIEKSDLDWWEYCLYVLRIHYRLTDELVGHFRLINDSTRLQIALASVEGQQIEKLAAAGSDPTDSLSIQDTEFATHGAKA